MNSTDVAETTPTQLVAFGRAWNRGLNYRQIENIVRQLNRQRASTGKPILTNFLPGYTRWKDVPEELRSETFNCAVALKYYRP